MRVRPKGTLPTTRGRGVQGCAAGVYRRVRQGCTGVCGRGVYGCAAGVYVGVAGVTGVCGKGVREGCTGVCSGCRGVQGCAARMYSGVQDRGVQGCAAGMYRVVQQGCTGVYRTGVCSV